MTETEASWPELRDSVEATRARARELRTHGVAIQQRLLATRQELAAVMDCTRALLSAVREQCASLSAKAAGQTASKPSSAVLKALTVLGRDEGDLGEVTDDLIAAYQAAVATGDDDTRLLLGGALMQIGRHIATQVGPKAAGVIMN